MCIINCSGAARWRFSHTFMTTDIYHAHMQHRSTRDLQPSVRAPDTRTAPTSAYLSNYRCRAYRAYPLSTNILRKKWILAKSGIEARLSTDQRSGMAWRYERATSCRPKIISGQRRRLFQCACGVWRSIRDNKPRLTQKIRRIDHTQRMPTAWGDRPAAPLRRKNVLGWPARVFGDIFFPIYVGDKF